MCFQVSETVKEESLFALVMLMSCRPRLGHCGTVRPWARAALSGVEGEHALVIPTDQEDWWQILGEDFQPGHVQCTGNCPFPCHRQAPASHKGEKSHWAQTPGQLQDRNKYDRWFYKDLNVKSNFLIFLILFFTLLRINEFKVCIWNITGRHLFPPQF